jgi:hypothetical protein
MIPYRALSPPHLLTKPLRKFLQTEAGRDLKSLTALFPAQWKVFVMGGLLRDLLLEIVPKSDIKPADADLVIFGANSIDAIRRALGSVNQSTNSFGGAKCQIRPHGLVFDIWRVEDHTNMASAAKPHTIEQLLRHNLLDVDAILWDPTTGCLHDCGCLDAIAAGRIGLMGREGISEKFIAVQVAHVLVVAYKTNFKLSEKVRAFVASASRRCAPGDIEQIIERKLPHAGVQIEAFWKDILRGGVQECPTPTRTLVPQTARAKRNSSVLNTRH